MAMKRKVEVMKAQELVKATKPLRDISYSQIIPVCFLCQKKDKKVVDDPNQEDDISFRNLDQSIASENSKKLQKNPFLVFGLGMNGYFNLIGDLIIVYIILSIMACLQIDILSGGNLT